MAKKKTTDTSKTPISTTTNATKARKARIAVIPRKAKDEEKTAALRKRVAAASAKISKQQAAADRKDLFRKVLLSMIAGRVPSLSMLVDDYIPAAHKIVDLVIKEEGK